MQLLEKNGFPIKYFGNDGTKKDFLQAIKLEMAGKICVL